jgi:3-phenylpropionate/trans-cinnamate dioxygenase ferredoxin reductase component
MSMGVSTSLMMLSDWRPGSDMERIIVAGAGQAGVRCAIRLRERGFAGSIKLIGEEGHLPYERPALSKDYITSGEPTFPEICSTDSFIEMDIDWVCGVAVKGVDWSERSVLAGSEQIGFDKLVVATGARPVTLAMEGLRQAHYLRTIEDAKAIRSLRPGRTAIIGGGVIGLELATSLAKAGHWVVVLEQEAKLASRSLQNDVADLLLHYHQQAGHNIMLGAHLTSVSKKGDGTATLRLADGNILEADHIIVGIGVRANIEWLGNAFANANGLPVDHHMCTELPDVWAIGDAAIVPHPLADAPVRMESWANANETAEIAAASILQQEPPEFEVPWIWSDQAGCHIQIIGFPKQCDRTLRLDGAEPTQTIFIHLRGNRLAAASLFNSQRSFRAIRKLVGAGVELSTTELSDANWSDLARRYAS